jgi:hypothetical protein
MHKGTVVVIHQPDFLPHIGFFHRLLNADVFIILDHIPLSKSGWVHRDKIKTAAGEEWVTVPVKKIGSQPIIGSAEIDYNHHYGKIIRTIEAQYRRAPYFRDLFPPMRDILESMPQRLIDLNLELLRLLLTWYDIRVDRMPLSSTLQVASKRSQMNADLIIAVEGATYLSGPGARAYHEDGPFVQAGISVIWQEFRHPVYPQLFGEFIPYLSSIDLLLNCGIQKSRSIIRSC